jgi:protein-S-isoprenylcysteine O-methyltransferase Ste14
MNGQGSKLLFKIARLRIIVSRIFAVLVVLPAVFTGSSFKQGSWTDMLLETSGLFLLTVCSIGRLWALLYISGNKKLELIVEGPYSMMQHPLYVFSLIGVIGIGLASENILVLAVLVVFYLLYYPLTVLVEEKKLVAEFGQVYLDYIKRVPRFLPKLSLYKSPSQVVVDTDIFLRNMMIGMWFIWIYILLNFIEALQQNGCVPMFLRVP